MTKLIIHTINSFQLLPVKYVKWAIITVKISSNTNSLPFYCFLAFSSNISFTDRMQFIVLGAIITMNCGAIHISTTANMVDTYCSSQWVSKKFRWNLKLSTVQWHTVPRQMINDTQVTGYFIHDCIDMLVHGEGRRYKEYVIHHMLVGVVCQWSTL